MKPLPIKGQTRDLGKPRNWDDAKLGHCGSLSIRDENFNGMPVMVSLWKPDAEELRVLNAGGGVQLHVFGNVHPPVAVNTVME